VKLKIDTPAQKANQYRSTANMKSPDFDPGEFSSDEMADLVNNHRKRSEDRYQRQIQPEVNILPIRMVAMRPNFLDQQKATKHHCLKDVHDGKDSKLFGANTARASRAGISAKCAATDYKEVLQWRFRLAADTTHHAF
jgi:hypothetical protein